LGYASLHFASHFSHFTSHFSHFASHFASHSRILLRILLRIFRILLRIFRILLRILRIMARLGPVVETLTGITVPRAPPGEHLYLPYERERNDDVGHGYKKRKADRVIGKRNGGEFGSLSQTEH
jgi:hypothetical protein